MTKDTFVILVSVDHYNARKICEHLQGSIYELNEDISVMCANEITQKIRVPILAKYSDDTYLDRMLYIYTMDEFMDACNDEDIELNQYFLGYVHLSCNVVSPELTAEYCGEVTIKDNNSPVELAVFKSPTGGLFGIDGSFIEQTFEGDTEAIVGDPLNGNQLTILRGID